MFFRRATAHNPSFQDRLASLRSAGFTVEPQAAGCVRAGRGICAALVADQAGQPVIQDRAGLAIHGDIAVLVDGGFQKFFQSQSGLKKPATADDLKALHEFEADLMQALGVESLYNKGLGTVSTLYHYDRVKDRDRGVPKRVWE